MRLLKDVLSLYISRAISSTSSNTGSLDTVTGENIEGTLPVVVIPRSIIDKFDYKKLDYKKIIANSPLIEGYGLLYDGSKLDEEYGELKDYIGIEDAISISALTRYILNYDKNIKSFSDSKKTISLSSKTKSIYRLINFALCENDYNNEVIKISESLSSRNNSSLYSRAFDIESDSNGFYIILNDNSFTDFPSMFDELSRELCVRMLQSIEGSFVYRSVFFKSL